MEYIENYLKSVRFEFHRYKALGDKTFAQIGETEIHWQYTENDNSIAVIVKHMAGNMLSRWTNFLTEDGEKTWRNREAEFENPPQTKKEILSIWNKGWQCLFGALDSIGPNHLNTPITIRNEEHTVIEAVNRQLAHYANHVGQIVFLGKMIKGKEWISLSIPKGGSEQFNAKKFKS